MVGGVEAGVVTAPGEDAGAVVVLPDGLVAVPGLPGCVDAGVVAVPGVEVKAGEVVGLPVVPVVPDTPVLPVGVLLGDGDARPPGAEGELGAVAVPAALPVAPTPLLTAPPGVVPPVFWPIALPLTTISTLRFIWRPAAVWLDAIGSDLPKPLPLTLLSETP